MKLLVYVYEKLLFCDAIDLGFQKFGLKEFSAANSYVEIRMRSTDLYVMFFSREKKIKSIAIFKVRSRYM